MTVGDNVGYGLMIRKVPQATNAGSAWLTRCAWSAWRDTSARKPSQLSGGQRQRVALARAIVNRPRVLLLDEPLGALDLKLRQEMQIELKEIQQQVGITFIYVTHDQEEALTMSDRMAVFDGGRIEQVGAPADVYERPATAFVAGFVGISNVISAEVAQALVGEPGPFTVRPEKIHLADPGQPTGPDDVTADRHHPRGRLPRLGDALPRAARRRGRARGHPAERDDIVHGGARRTGPSRSDSSGSDGTRCPSRRDRQRQPRRGGSSAPNREASMVGRRARRRPGHHSLYRWREPDSGSHADGRPDVGADGRSDRCADGRTDRCADVTRRPKPPAKPPPNPQRGALRADRRSSRTARRGDRARRRRGRARTSSPGAYYVEDGTQRSDRRLGQPSSRPRPAARSTSRSATPRTRCSRSCRPATTTWSRRQVTPRTGSSPRARSSPST